jgi:tetratricopeptide (TPR) repeat protein
MTERHFVSYSTEGADFAFKLGDALTAGSPSFKVYLDKRELRAGRPWEAQLDEAIRTCASLLFVMTPDSVHEQSICTQEWRRALRYKKPIVPLRLSRNAELPFRLEGLQYIDCTGNFDRALERLRDDLAWLASPKGKLQVLRDRKGGAERDLPRAHDDTEAARIRDEIALLEKQIAELEQVVADPEGAQARVEERTRRGLKRESQPERDVSRSKSINPPPTIAPSYFQGRIEETRLLGAYLKDDSKRLIAVVGRAGIGKTALVCRLLRALECGQLPDDEGELDVDGIVYLDACQKHRSLVDEIHRGLLKLLPTKQAKSLADLYQQGGTPLEDKMSALLQALPSGRLVLLLDNFEDVVDPETENISDGDLDEALRCLLNAPHHAVKTILTTRIAPRELMLLQPGRQARVELDEGLESPYAENILREMDMDGKLGLRDAPDELLDLARQRTLGYPRALEALFAILSADRYTTLEELLSDAEHLLPKHVVEVLVGEAFSRLDASAQRVMEALAMYGRPVTATAVDYMLQPYLPGVNSAPILNRLVTMHLCQREADRYKLHPVDLAYATSRVPSGAPEDYGRAEGTPPYTTNALLRRGAGYYQETRKRTEWKTIEDLDPQLAEFDLLCAAEDFDTAASVLLVIDWNYLFKWGHYQRLAEMHERLQGRLGASQSEQSSVGRLGNAYRRIGRYREAIACYKHALEIARRNDPPSQQGAYLIGLGSSYAELGQITCAIEYQEQALDISRRTGRYRLQGQALGSLANRYADLGQTARAIEYYERALESADETGDPRGKAIRLGNLGERYAELGQTARALECYDQSWELARAEHYRLMEAGSLANKGDALVDSGELAQAEQAYEQAIQIADDIHSVERQARARTGLAEGYLLTGNMLAARNAAQSARAHEFPRTAHDTLALLGVIAIRQEDGEAAREAFAAAVACADEILAHTPQFIGALEAKGLALTGLALCGDEPAVRLAAAIEAYRAARDINCDAGRVKRVLRRLDALAQAVAAGEVTLAQVRAAAGGEGP